MKTLSAKALRRCAGVVLFSVSLRLASAGDLTAIPGPDDQGGMLMPMITLTGNTLKRDFNPAATPLLQSLSTWRPGSTFADGSAWNALLDPVDGQGALFNNQYGFMFMANPAMGADYVPVGESLAIRLLARSSPLLASWNCVNSQNRFDAVFASVGDQVLWNGSMWHNYFTLPSTAAPGVYTASFEVFVASAAFTAGSGFADSSPAAQAAEKDANFQSVTVDYTWLVVPEPSSPALLLASAAGFFCLRRMRHGARRESAR